MKRFSIITVTFNAERFLRETLESVICQEFSDYEHIIWDGGSSDGTLEIIKSYPHVKLFQGKDSGISDAMNQGAFQAEGEFLIHLHADDLLAHPKSLLFIDTSLKQHPQIKWVYGRVNIIDDKGEKKELSGFRNYDYRRLKKYNCISHPAVFVSRQLFVDAGGFDTKLRYAMDYDLWLRLGSVVPALALPQVVSSFRVHGNSLSTSQPIEVAQEAYTVRNRYLSSCLEKMGSYRTFKRRLKTCL